MTPSPKVPKGSEQFQDDCTGLNFVRKRADLQVDRKQWGTKRDLDRYYIITVLRDQTALDAMEYHKDPPPPELPKNTSWYKVA